jgi:hypothetical protein
LWETETNKNYIFIFEITMSNVDDSDYLIAIELQKQFDKEIIDLSSDEDVGISEKQQVLNANFDP